MSNVRRLFDSFSRNRSDHFATCIERSHYEIGSLTLNHVITPRKVVSLLSGNNLVITPETKGSFGGKVIRGESLINMSIQG